MKNSDIALLRSHLEAKLAQTPGLLHAIRVLAHECNVDQGKVKYNLDWLRLNRGMRIEKVANGIVRFDGYRERANDEVESRRGRVDPIIGQCDYCPNHFVIDGHTRFCSIECRAAFASLSPDAREKHIANKISETWGDHKESPRQEIIKEPTVREFKDVNDKVMALVRRNNQLAASGALPQTLDEMDPSLEGDIDPMDETADRDMGNSLEIVEK